MLQRVLQNFESPIMEVVRLTFAQVSFDSFRHGRFGGVCSPCARFGVGGLAEVVRLALA